MLILVDFGSSHTFLSAALADRLSGVVPLSQPLSIKVASGSSICYTLQLQDAC
jgi:hypothetical protein